MTKTKASKPLKRSKTGIEAEFHIIDNKGLISNRAGEIINNLHEKHKNIDVTSEIGQNMIEFGCYPDVKEYNPTMHLLNSIDQANEICNKKDLMLFPFATYPGKFEPQMTPKAVYKMKMKIFGRSRIKNSMYATGFHHHYTLPKGVFDEKTKTLKFQKRSKLERSMMSSYNFEIAADPALTLFAQSSPYFQGRFLGKDSRVILYRGGKKLKYMGGLYAKLQQMGGLPPYKQTVTDLLISLSNRWKRWKKEVKSADPNANFDELYNYKLDIGWHPVKLNKHGTLEQRGMDINYMSQIVALTVALKFCLKNIQREFKEVIPADLAIDKPFKVENEILYIPPHSYVRNHLQKWSAYDGFDKPEIYNYTKRFFSFVKNVTPKKYTSIIRPMYDMVDKKESMSDQIMAYAKKKGFVDNGKMDDSGAQEISLHFADRFPADLNKTREALEKVSLL